MRKNSEITTCLSPGVLVQITHLSWDKAARGGPLATKRNAVPSAFPISSLALENLGGSLEVEMKMWGHDNDFAVPFRSWHGQHDLSKKFEWECVRVDFKKSELNVVWDGKKMGTGAPRRPFSIKLALQAEQWAQIRWNGRFLDRDSGAWWYEQTTFNVALCHTFPDSELFLSSQPSARIEQMAWLR